MNDIKGSYFFKAGDEINLEKYEFFKDRAKRYVAVRTVNVTGYVRLGFAAMTLFLER
mgnify:CR=1 FL=1